MHDAKIKFFKLHIWAQIHAKTKYNIWDALDNNTKLQYIFTVTSTQVISLSQNYIFSTDTTNNIVTTYTHPCI